MAARRHACSTTSPSSLLRSRFASSSVARCRSRPGGSGRWLRQGRPGRVPPSRTSRNSSVAQRPPPVPYGVPTRSPRETHPHRRLHRARAPRRAITGCRVRKPDSAGDRCLLLFDKLEDPGDAAGVLWGISVNRRASTSIWRSRLTVKADAAARLFDASTAGIRWAVLDTGIDATHPHSGAAALPDQS